jgi:hypothetical protein
MRFMQIRPNTPRPIALIACLGTAFAIGGCGDGDGTTPPTPVLLGVLDAPCAEIPPGTTGGFRVMPSGKVGVGLRVAAAWPSADLIVKANGTELEKVGPSDTGRQIELQGDPDNPDPTKRKPPIADYWVPANIDPNPTPPVWTVKVGLPKSMGVGPLTLELTSRRPDGTSSSPLTVEFVQDLRAQTPARHEVQLDWRDREDETSYLLERSENGQPYAGLVGLLANETNYTDTQVKDETNYSYRLKAMGCPGSITPGGRVFSSSTVDVTTQAGPSSGDREITFFPSTDPGDDQFDYTNPNSLFMPEGAVVTSVTNVSTEERGLDLPLGSVRHADADGVSRSLPGSCPTGVLQKDESTARFDGQKVEGEWKVRVCANATFLDGFGVGASPPRIAIKITWAK